MFYLGSLQVVTLKEALLQTRDVKNSQLPSVKTFIFRAKKPRKKSDNAIKWNWKLCQKKGWRCPAWLPSPLLTHECSFLSEKEQAPSFQLAFQEVRLTYSRRNLWRQAATLWQLQLKLRWCTCQLHTVLREMLAEQPWEEQGKLLWASSG